MAIPSKVIKFLEKAKVKYEPLQHRTVYTAHDKAATLRVPQKIVGKTLVVGLDKTLALVLIPANKNLDKGKLKKTAKAKKIDFASERLIKSRLNGAKVGAIPPFGELWKSCPKAARGAGCRLPTFIDGSLLREPKIIVNSGDHKWSVKISPAGLKKLMPETLTVGNFAKKR